MDTAQYILLLISSGLVLVAATAVAGQLVPTLDLVIKTRIGSLVDQAEALELRLQLIRRCLQLWCVIMIVLPITLVVMGRWGIAIGLTLAIYTLPNHVMQYLIARRKTLIRDQLIVAMQGLSNTVESGLTLNLGIVEVAKDAPQPIAGILRRISSDFDRGRPLAEAIEDVRVRLNLECFTLFASAIQLSLKNGGRLNCTLGRIASSLNEHQKMERKIEADTASGRREVLLLSLFPLILGGMLFVMDSEKANLLHSTTLGQVVVLIVGALVYAGASWASRIADIER